MDVKPNLIKPRWSKVLADLWDNKLRTLLVVASIAVGVFAIGMIVSTYAILSEDFNLSYVLVNPVNIEVWTDRFSEDFLRVIEQIPGVETAEGRRIFGVRGSKNGVAWESLDLIAVKDFEAAQINLLAPLEGTHYPQRRELLISYDFMNNTDFKVGDQVEIELPNGVSYTMPVVGIVADQASGGGDIRSGPFAYVTLDTLSSLSQDQTFNRLYVTVDGTGSDVAVIDAIAALVADKVERNSRTVYRMDMLVSNVHPMGATVLAVLGVLGVLGGLITILSSSLIINTLNALITQHMRQIGVMKLIGGRRVQIMGMYLTLIFAYGLVALALAVPSGALAGYEFAGFISSMMNTSLQPFRVVPVAIVLQALLAFLIPLGAGFFPVNRGSKINVRRAISNERAQAQSTGLKWFNRFTQWLGWMSRPILLSIRNTFRQKGRLLLTIFTLTVAGAVFIAVFNVRVSMSAFMDQLSAHFMGDVSVYFSQPYSITRIKQLVLPLPGVEQIEAWGGASGEIWDADDNVVDNINLIASPPDTVLLDADVVAGRWLNPGEEKALVVADSIYEHYPNLKPGDSLIIKMPGEREEAWQVVGLFRFVSMMGDMLAYADYNFIADINHLPNQAYSFKIITDNHTLEGQRDIGQVIDQYLSDRGFNIRSVEAGKLIREDSSQAIDILVRFLLIMALLTAFVGSIGLTGTMGMNVLERTREIGVMRAIGAVDFEIIKSIVIEGLVIGLITWTLAIGLSFPISRFLLQIISEAMMGSSVQLAYTSDGIFIWLGVVLSLSVIASILPARNAARLTIREVLAYE